MSQKEASVLEREAGDARRAIHDVAAAIISVRALAETLAEHVPTLVAVSRSRFTANSQLVQPQTLDSLPSIPKEIIDLCAFAQRTLQAFGGKSSAIESQNATPAYDSATAETRGSATPDDRVDGKGTRVLLVEDEETFRYALSRRLLAQGYSVTLCGDGEEALRLLDETDFDLVLMDLRLRGMSGCETAKRLREIESAQGRNTRIVGMTASPLTEDQVLAKNAGMDEVLVKPIDEVALRSLLSFLT